MVKFLGRSWNFRSPESRASLADPDPELKAFFAGGPTDSGMSVNEVTALNLSAYFSGVRVLAETVASLPIFVNRRRNGSRENMRNLPESRSNSLD